MTATTIASALCLVATSCTNLSNPDIETTAVGKIQKGPYIQGSSIQWQDLNAHFEPTGNVYNTETTDDLGRFTLSGLSAAYADINAEGFYFNEVSGELSMAPLMLRAIMEPSGDRTMNINVLTTLARPRIKHLIATDGVDIATARATAEQEVLTALGLADCGAQRSLPFDEMDLGATGIGAAVLIAASIALQGHQTVGELAELLAIIGEDLASDGTLDNSEVTDRIRAVKSTLNLAEIRGHLESRYSEVAPFELCFPGPQLVLHYKMDEDDNAPIAEDCSGFANNGTYMGTMSVGGTARQFNGWADKITVEATDELDLGRDNHNFSIAFNMTLQRGFTSIWRTLLFNDGESSTLSVRMHPHDNRLVAALNLQGGSRVVSYSSVELIVGEQTHVALVRDGNEFKTYFNAHVVQTVLLNGVTESAPGTLFIGSHEPPHGTESILDDFRIYSGALNARALAELGNL